MTCNSCISRRDFLTRSAIAAAVLVVAEGCGDGQIGPPMHATVPGGDPNLPLGGPVTVKLSDFAGLATVGTLVDIGSERAAMRTGPTTFLALSRICTHQQCDTDVRNNRFECPCHGSIFAADGSVIRGPDVEAPPNTPLRKLAVTFDAAAGTITVA
jgi:cytochrome b6-f complex iron-sulfur subunit